MSNYGLVGSLSAALDDLYQAAGTVRYAQDGSPDAKLRDRIYSAQRTIESIEKTAKKLIPGGFKPLPNARKDDKRAQREAIATGGAS